MATEAGSATTKKLRDGTKAVHLYYRCRNPECTGGGDGRVNVRKADMEDRFVRHLDGLRAPEGLASLFAEVLRDTFRERHRDQEVARRAKMIDDDVSLECLNNYLLHEGRTPRASAVRDQVWQSLRTQLRSCLPPPPRTCRKCVAASPC